MAEETGIWIYGVRTKYFESLVMCPSIFQAEIHVIGSSVHCNFDRSYEIQKIKKMAWDCLNKLNELGKRNKEGGP